jgi:hypothetical protein
LSDVGDSAVILPASPEALFCTRLEVVSDDERFVSNPPSSIGDMTGRPRTVTLRPGQSLTGWFDLNDFATISPGSGYRVRAVLDTRPFKGVDGIWCSTVTSGFGDFTVIAAEGEDAKAAKLVEAAIAATGAGRYRGYVFRDNREPDLLKQILERTNSNRFHAVADFFMGLRDYPDDGRRGHYGFPGNRDSLKKATYHFDRCANNPGTSERMKALAMYYAMRCRAEEVMLTPREQTTEAAYRIIDGFPGTYAADQTEKFLASMGSPVTSTVSQRFWLRQRFRLTAAAVALPCLIIAYLVFRWRVRVSRAARHACPRCGYDVTATASGVCPECGGPAPVPAPAPPAPPSA